MMWWTLRRLQVRLRSADSCGQPAPRPGLRLGEGRVLRKAFRVVHVFVARQAAVHQLPQL
jgi:hypothetical protein